MKDINALTLEQLYEAISPKGIEAGLGSLFRRALELARDEDLGFTERGGSGGGPHGDVTSEACFPDGAPPCTARLIAREPGVIAGLRFIPELQAFFRTDDRMQWRAEARDGEPIVRGQQLGTLSGHLPTILGVERTLLNLLSRLSGIATLTALHVAEVADFKVSLFDTRKTTPGLRTFEKYAVRCGGGYCHRLGLYDALLIKDNHRAGIPPERLAQWVTGCVQRARATAVARGSLLSFCELEVDTPDQFRSIVDAGGCGLDIILLDNMTTDQLAECVKARNSARSPLLLEASGGVRFETLQAIASTGVDRISVGALTHHAVSLDLALDL